MNDQTGRAPRPMPFRVRSLTCGEAGYLRRVRHVGQDFRTFRLNAETIRHFSVEGSKDIPLLTSKTPPGQPSSLDFSSRATSTAGGALMSVAVYDAGLGGITAIAAAMGIPLRCRRSEARGGDSNPPLVAERIESTFSTTAFRLSGRRIEQ